MSRLLPRLLLLAFLGLQASPIASDEQDVQRAPGKVRQPQKTRAASKTTIRKWLDLRSQYLSENQHLSNERRDAIMNGGLVRGMTAYEVTLVWDRPASRTYSKTADGIDQKWSFKWGLQPRPGITNAAPQWLSGSYDLFFRKGVLLRWQRQASSSLREPSFDEASAPAEP